MKRLAPMLVAGCLAVAAQSSPAMAAVADTKPCAAESTTYYTAIDDRQAALATLADKREAMYAAADAYTADPTPANKQLLLDARAAFDDAKAVVVSKEASQQTAKVQRETCLLDVGKPSAQVTCEGLGGTWNGTYEASKYFQTSNHFTCGGFGNSADSLAAARALQGDCIAKSGQIANYYAWMTPAWEAGCLAINA